MSLGHPVAESCDGGILRFWPDPGPDTSRGMCCSRAGSTDVVYIVDVDGERLPVIARHMLDSSEQALAELDEIVSSIQIDPPAPRPSPSL